MNKGIRFRGVSKGFARGSEREWALQDIDLYLAPGEFVGLAGANGSGKSTLARLVNGLSLPTEGLVTVDGIATWDGKGLREIRSRVGMVFQNPDNQLVTTVVEEEVAFGPGNLGLSHDEVQRRVAGALAAAGIEELRNRAVPSLSGGQKQKLAIAAALAMEPAYLVLDEPTSMLDPQSRAAVLEVVCRLQRERKVGILLVSHAMEDLQRTERLVILHEGRICFDGLTPLGFVQMMKNPQWGMAAPSLYRMAKNLLAEGLPVNPFAPTPEQMGESLWQRWNCRM